MATNSEIGMINAKTNSAKLQEDARHNLVTEDVDKQNAKSKERESLAKKMDAETRKGESTSKKFANYMSPISGMLKSVNDPAWYKKYPELMRNALNLSTYSILGAKRRLIADGTDMHDYTVNTENVFIPGILKVYVDMVPGATGSALEDTTGAQSLTSVTNAMLQFIRSKTAGAATTYDGADIYIMLEAIGNMYAFIGEMHRLYGLANNFKALNYYYGKAFIQSLGFSYSSLFGSRQSRQDFLAFIDYITAQINQIFVPSDIEFLKRRLWIFSNVFKDGDYPQAQSYVFVPSWYRVYRLHDSLGGILRVGGTNALNDRLNLDNAITLSDLYDAWDEMYLAVVRQQDYPNIQSDLRRAYGEGNHYTIPYLNDKYICEPTVDEYALNQFRAANVLGTFQPDSTQYWDKEEASLEWIWQEDGIIQCHPVAVDSPQSPEEEVLPGLGYAWHNGVVIFDKADPDPDLILEMTRTHPIVSFSRNTVPTPDGTISYQEVLSCGLEIPRAVQIVNFLEYEGQIVPAAINLGYQYSSNGCLVPGLFLTADDSQSFVNDVTTVMAYNQFKYAPLLPVIMLRKTDPADHPTWRTIEGYTYFSDLNNANVIPKSNIVRINNAAMYSTLLSKEAALVVGPRPSSGDGRGYGRNNNGKKGKGR